MRVSLDAECSRDGCCALAVDTLALALWAKHHFARACSRVAFVQNSHSLTHTLFHSHFTRLKQRRTTAQSKCGCLTPMNSSKYPLPTHTNRSASDHSLRTHIPLPIQRQSARNLHSQSQQNRTKSQCQSLRHRIALSTFHRESLHPTRGSVVLETTNSHRMCWSMKAQSAMHSREFVR